MGIDYGTKKLGIAFSDPTGTIAFPHAVIPNSPKLLDVLLGLIAEKSVEKIVIGQSLGKDMKPNAVQKEIDALVLDLTLETGLPVHLEPEWFTSQAATRLQDRHAKTDASAAALILESFLLKQR